ncbi:uncharacterized protein LOC134536310 [Bacillus rossius redtenbacheri]|uniref:uncharacterized protein LOC134536310 n=1 Tax=Bacillus rossius redtenbacheri TaxID=93214 RepID=UPI002FDC8EE0
MKYRQVLKAAEERDCREPRGDPSTASSVSTASSRLSEHRPRSTEPGRTSWQLGSLTEEEVTRRLDRELARASQEFDDDNDDVDKACVWRQARALRQTEAELGRRQAEHPDLHGLRKMLTKVGGPLREEEVTWRLEQELARAGQELDDDAACARRVARALRQTEAEMGRQQAEPLELRRLREMRAKVGGSLREEEVTWRLEQELAQAGQEPDDGNACARRVARSLRQTEAELGRRIEPEPPELRRLREMRAKVGGPLAQDPIIPPARDIEALKSRLSSLRTRRMAVEAAADIPEFIIVDQRKPDTMSPGYLRSGRVSAEPPTEILIDL